MLAVNCLIFFLILLFYILMAEPGIPALASILSGAVLMYVFLNEYCLAFLFISLSLLAAFTVLSKKKDIFAPWITFICLWLFAIGICSLNITIFEKPWSEYMWFVILTAIFSFLAGCAGPYVLLYKGHVNGGMFATIRQRIASCWSSSGFVAAMFPLFLLSAGIFIYQYRAAHVIPIFAGWSGMTIDFARNYVAINSYMQRIALTLVPVFMACAVFLMLDGKRWARRLSWAVFLISLLLIISYASRLFLGTALISAFIAYHYLRGRVNMKTAFVAALLAILFIVSIPVYIRGILPQSYLEDIGFKPAYVFAAPLYLGVSMNFFVMENLIDYVHANGFSYGGLTAYPVMALFQQKERLLNTAQGLTPGAEWMTATILGEFYGDFGIFGVIIEMFLLGLFVSFVYLRMLSRPTPFNVMMHSYNMWNIIFSIYANAFILFDYPWNIFILFTINLIACNIGWKKEAK